MLPASISVSIFFLYKEPCSCVRLGLSFNFDQETLGCQDKLLYRSNVYGAHATCCVSYCSGCSNRSVDSSKEVSKINSVSDFQSVSGGSIDEPGETTQLVKHQDQRLIPETHTKREKSQGTGACLVLQPWGGKLNGSMGLTSQ